MRRRSAGAPRCGTFEPVPRLVLFDLDDTLCDYATARASRLRRAFTLHVADGEEPPTEQTIREMIAASIAQSPHGVDHFPRLFSHFGIEAPNAAAAAADWYRSNRFHDLKLFPEVISILGSLRYLRLPDGSRVRRRLGIITNGPAQVQSDKVALLAIGTLVDFVIISGEFGVEKPDPRIFEEAMRLGGVTSEETVFVGDDPRFDILGAQNAGIRSIWVNRRDVIWTEPNWSPTCQVSDLAGLVDLLGSPRT